MLAEQFFSAIESVTGADPLTALIIVCGALLGLVLLLRAQAKALSKVLSNLNTFGKVAIIIGISLGLLFYSTDTQQSELVIALAMLGAIFLGRFGVGALQDQADNL